MGINIWIMDVCRQQKPINDLIRFMILTCSNNLEYNGEKCIHACEINKFICIAIGSFCRMILKFIYKSSYTSSALCTLL